MIFDTEESLVEPSAAADTVFLDFLELLALDCKANEDEYVHLCGIVTIYATCLGTCV